MAFENDPVARRGLSPSRRLGQAVACVLVVASLAASGVAAFRTWRAAADESQAQDLARVSPDAALGALAAALHWRPDNADLWRERAGYAAFSAPSSAREYVRRAIALDPQDWRAWQTLGLLDFQLGDRAGSQRALAAATRFDHGFESHFALGNLALVQGNEPQFMKEMAAALAIAPVDRVSYALRQTLGHANLPPAGLASLLPAGRAEVVASGIEFFLLNGKFAAAIESWKRLRCQSYQFADCRDAALALANGLVAAAFVATPATPGQTLSADPEVPSPSNLVAAAIAVWNRSVRDGLLAQSAVVPGTVSDGQFRRAWVGPAFSWEPARVLTLQALPALAPRGDAVRIPFNGYQPDEAVLLREFVPVEPGATYSVSYRSRRQLAGSETGLELQVLAAPNRKLAVVPAQLNQGWSLNSATISVPRGVRLLELAFAFSRPHGQVRMHDPALIADVALEALAR